MCGRPECGHLRGPTTHPGHLRRRCRSRPAPARAPAPLRRRSAGSQPAPGSGLPAPAGPGLVERGGAGRLRPRPRPREGSGLPSTPSTADPVPSPAVARRWPEVAPLASDFTAFWIWFSTWGKGRTARDRELNYLAALTKLTIGLYCYLPYPVRSQTGSALLSFPRNKENP